MTLIGITCKEFKTVGICDNGLNFDVFRTRILANTLVVMTLCPVICMS